MLRIVFYHEYAKIDPNLTKENQLVQQPIPLTGWNVFKYSLDDII